MGKFARFSRSSYGSQQEEQLRQKQKVPSHMEEEHASREKKIPKIIFLIFVHRNVYKIGFQVIKICPREDFGLGPFFTFPHEKTTFQWSNVVSEAIFPTNQGKI